MRTTKVSATWTGEQLNYVGTDSKGKTLQMGGDNFSPGQMLLMAFAGCMGMDVMHVLNKKKQAVTDVQVEVVGHQQEEYPRPYEIVEIAFTITGTDVSEKAVERAIALSQDTYCVVGQSLKNPVELKTSFTVQAE